MTFHLSTALWLAHQDKNICTIHSRFFFLSPVIFLYGKNVKILALQMVRWSRDRRYSAAVTQCIWTRTRHTPYFPRLLFQPLRDYFIIPLWVEELCKHSCLLGLLLLKCEQGVSSQWSSCPVLAMASVGVCRRAEWGQLPLNLKEQPERRLGPGLKYITTEFTA